MVVGSETKYSNRVFSAIDMDQNKIRIITHNDIGRRTHKKLNFQFTRQMIKPQVDDVHPANMRENANGHRVNQHEFHGTFPTTGKGESDLHPKMLKDEKNITIKVDDLHPNAYKQTFNDCRCDKAHTESITVGQGQTFVGCDADVHPMLARESANK